MTIGISELLHYLQDTGRLLLDLRNYGRSSPRRGLPALALQIAVIALAAVVCLCWRATRNREREAKFVQDWAVAWRNEPSQRQYLLLEMVAKDQANIEARDAHRVWELEKAASAAARATHQPYDFYGARITASGEDTRGTLGPSLLVLARMQRMEGDAQFAELAALCRTQILDTPDWLTPYLFLGIASANLGKNREAVEMFEFVLRKAIGGSNHDQADEFPSTVRANEGSR